MKTIGGQQKRERTKEMQISYGSSAAMYTI